MAWHGAQPNSWRLSWPVTSAYRLECRLRAWGRTGQTAMLQTTGHGAVRARQPCCPAIARTQNSPSFRTRLHSPPTRRFCGSTCSFLPGIASIFLPVGFMAQTLTVSVSNLLLPLLFRFVPAFLLVFSFCFSFPFPLFSLGVPGCSGSAVSQTFDARTDSEATGLRVVVD